MTDEDDDRPNGKKDKGDRDRAKATPDIVPSDAPFAEWLERLFYQKPETAHYPERIEIWSVKGQRSETNVARVMQQIYAPSKASDEAVKKMPGRSKPTREELMSFSNEIRYRVQRECDEARRGSQVYMVYAWHHARGDEPYDRWPIRCAPKNRYQKDDVDEEEKVSSAERFSTQVLGHQEKMISLMASSFEGFIDRDDRALERAYKRIADLERQLEIKSDQLERALSLEIEREERRMWNAIKIKGADRGMNLVEGLAPTLVGALVGKKLTDETPETLTLKNFFKTVKEGGQLTPAQSDAAFGIYDTNPPHDLKKAGVLTADQAQLLYAVAHCKMPPDRLDELMPGGPHEITMPQLGALMSDCGFTMEQLAPLRILFDARQKRRAAS